MGGSFVGHSSHSPWLGCGEIDIMEFVSPTPGFVHTTVHFQKNGK